MSTPATMIPRPFSELAASRRTIHRFRPGTVPSEALDAAFEAAHFAPCHRHTWPWRFTLIGDETRGKIDAASRAKKGAGLSGEALTIFEEKMIHPTLVVATQRRTQDPKQAKEDYAAVACAMR